MKLFFKTKLLYEVSKTKYIPLRHTTPNRISHSIDSLPSYLPILCIIYIPHFHFIFPFVVRQPTVIAHVGVLNSLIVVMRGAN